MGDDRSNKSGFKRVDGVVMYTDRFNKSGFIVRSLRVSYQGVLKGKVQRRRDTQCLYKVV